MWISKKSLFNFITAFEEDNKIAPEFKLNYLRRVNLTRLLNLTIMMFNPLGLPEELNKMDMERWTQLIGYSFFMKVKDKYFVSRCCLVEEPTTNYQPKHVTIDNPELFKLYPEARKSIYEDGVDGIILRNDWYLMGLYDILNLGATQTAHADLTIIKKLIDMRLNKVFTAESDEEVESLNTLFSDVANGENVNAVISNNLYKKSIDGVDNIQPNNVKDVIEFEQYVDSKTLMKVGIDANYNMKRESLNENELKANDDALLPLIDNMFEVRKIDYDKINKLYPELKLSVELTSSWYKLYNEIKIELDNAKAELEKTKAETINDDAKFDSNESDAKKEEVEAEVKKEEGVENV